jgi:hypothetical protein
MAFSSIELKDGKSKKLNNNLLIKIYYCILLNRFQTVVGNRGEANCDDDSSEGRIHQNSGICRQQAAAL